MVSYTSALKDGIHTLTWAFTDSERRTTLVRFIGLITGARIAAGSSISGKIEITPDGLQNRTFDISGRIIRVSHDLKKPSAFVIEDLRTVAPSRADAWLWKHNAEMNIYTRVVEICTTTDSGVLQWLKVAKRTPNGYEGYVWYGDCQINSGTFSTELRPLTGKHYSEKATYEGVWQYGTDEDPNASIFRGRIEWTDPDRTFSGVYFPSSGYADGKMSYFAMGFEGQFHNWKYISGTLSSNANVNLGFVKKSGLFVNSELVKGECVRNCIVVGDRIANGTFEFEYDNGTVVAGNFYYEGREEILRRYTGKIGAEAPLGTGKLSLYFEGHIDLKGEFENYDFLKGTLEYSPRCSYETICATVDGRKIMYGSSTYVGTLPDRITLNDIKSAISGGFFRSAAVTGAEPVLGAVVKSA